MSLTAHEFEYAFVNAYGNYGWDYSKEYFRGRDTLEVRDETYSFEWIDGYNQSEEQESEQLWVVFRVGHQHFRKTGYNVSHYGSEWDGPVVEVFGREVTKIEWGPES